MGCFCLLFFCLGSKAVHQLIELCPLLIGMCHMGSVFSPTQRQGTIQALLTVLTSMPSPSYPFIPLSAPSCKTTNQSTSAPSSHPSTPVLSTLQSPHLNWTSQKNCPQHFQWPRDAKMHINGLGRVMCSITFLSYNAFERSPTFLTNMKSTKKSRGHSFFVLFFYFLHKNHEKSQKSTRKA